MKKRRFVWLYCILVLMFLAVCAIPVVSFAEGKIKGPAPEVFPPPEKCAACHNIDNTYSELSKGIHSELKCLDCHIPGKVLRSKYESKDCSFSRLGYYKEGGNWIECTDSNQVCLRCHKDKKGSFTEKCVSCHMPKSGMIEIIIVKDKKAGLTSENIRKIKKELHRRHDFRYHGK